MSDENWDRRATTYDGIKWVNDPDLLRWVASSATAALTGAPGASEATDAPVLEVGVGSGALTRALLDGGLRVHGCDVSRAMLDLCRGRCEGAERWLTLGLVEPSTVPLRPRGWRGVVSRMVLHHAPRHPREQVAAWLDAVAPGCAVVVAEGPPPVTERSHPAWALYERAMGVKEPGRWVFTAAAVGQWMLDAGCEGVAVTERWSRGNSTRQWALGGGMEPGAAEALVAVHRERVEADPLVREAYAAEVTRDGDVLLRYRHCVVAGWRG